MKAKQTKAGVPQVSKISPLHFTFHVLDIPTTINMEIALYTDDSAIYSNFKKLIRCFKIFKLT